MTAEVPLTDAAGLGQGFDDKEGERWIAWPLRR